jgi:hypothetical protein
VVDWIDPRKAPMTGADGSCFPQELEKIMLTEIEMATRPSSPHEDHLVQAEVLWGCLKVG